MKPAGNIGLVGPAAETFLDLFRYGGRVLVVGAKGSGLQGDSLADDVVGEHGVCPFEIGEVTDQLPDPGPNFRTCHRDKIVDGQVDRMPAIMTAAGFGGGVALGALREADNLTHQPRPPLRA